MDKGQRTFPDSKLMVELEAAHMQQLSKSTIFQKQLQLRRAWLDLTMKTVVTADVDCRKFSEDLFHVFTSLGTRWVSHHQALFALIMPGRYGEAIAVSRILLEATELIRYFGLYPGDASEWRGLQSKVPSTLTKSERGKLREKYSPKQIGEKLDLKDAGLLSRRLYSDLSAAVHPTDWGVQFYGRRFLEDPKMIGLQFGPAYDPRRLFNLNALANGTLPSPVWAFLSMCQWADVPDKLWAPIGVEYSDLQPLWYAMTKVDAEMDEVMEETERRIGAGESVDIVMGDFEKSIGFLEPDSKV